MDISELHCSVILSLAHTDWHSPEGRDSLVTQRRKAHSALLDILQQVIAALPGKIFNVLLD